MYRVPTKDWEKRRTVRNGCPTTKQDTPEKGRPDCLALPRPNIVGERDCVRLVRSHLGLATKFGSRGPTFLQDRRH